LSHRRWGRAAVALALAAAALFATAADGGASAATTGIELHRIAEFDHPTYVTQAPGEPRTLYVTTQPGRVMAVRKGTKLPRPFLDITDRVSYGFKEAKSVEAGLLSIAFDPDYALNRRFYAFYTGRDGNNRVDRFRRAAGGGVRAVGGSRRAVLRIVHPWTDSHNGGQLQFGPDGFLWISTGDGGCCEDYHDQARNLQSQLGKLLRVDPRARGGGFDAPIDNPLVAVPGSEAILAWGLRNPWRFSFDRLTGNLIVTDVGDNEGAREEIDYLSAAAAPATNFGWPEYAGLEIFDPERPGPGKPLAPVSSYEHTGGRCAITGGYVVRDPTLPQLYGRYLYSDYCGGRIRSLTPPALAGGYPASPSADDRDEGLYLRNPTSFGEGLAGQIYVASRAGPVYRLRARR
jgi:glucose/arabinose dehydrogenase